MNKLFSGLIIAVLFMLTLAVPAIGATQADANIGLDGPIVGADGSSVDTEVFALLALQKVNANEATYRQLVATITDITMDSVKNMQSSFKQMGENPTLVFDNEFVVDVCGEFAVWEALYKLVDGIEAPKGFKEIHSELTDAYRYLALAGGEYRTGILNVDAASIRAGTDYLGMGTEHLEEASRLLEEKNSDK